MPVWAAAYLQDVSRKEMFTSQWVWTLSEEKQRVSSRPPESSKTLSLEGTAESRLLEMSQRVPSLLLLLNPNSESLEGWGQVGK